MPSSEGPLARPVFEATPEEWLGVAIGYGLRKPACPFPEKYRLAAPGWGTPWLKVVELARSGLCPDGTPMPREDFLALQKLADLGALLREAGCRVRLATGPLPPLELRLAQLEPHVKAYLAAKKRSKAVGPDQRELFAEGS